MTNTEFVTRLMEYSKTGVMSQLFIMNAIEKVARSTVDNADDLIKDMENSFISGEAWVAAAREILDELEARK